MRPFLLTVLTYACFVLDTSVVPSFDWGALAPRFVPAALVLCGWSSGRRSGLVAAAAMGLFADGLSRGRMGIGLIAFVTAAYGVQSIRARRPALSTFGAAGLTGVVAFAIGAMLPAVRSLIERTPLELTSLLERAAGESLSTSLLVWLLLACGSMIRPAIREESAPSVSNRWKMLTG